MKFLCTGCERLLEAARFRVEGAVLIVTCAACGAESRAVGEGGAGSSAPADAARPFGAEPSNVTPLPGAAGPSNVTPLRTPTAEAIARAAGVVGERAFEVPPGHCPKCISKRAAQALACPTCGLVFAQAQGESFAPSEWLKSEWLELLTRWGDDARHEALRQEAMGRGELAEVGRLYRLRLAELPQDPYAARGRDEVLRLAVLPSLHLSKQPTEPEVPKWKYIALSAVIVACLVAIYLLVGQILRTS